MARETAPHRSVLYGNLLRLAFTAGTPCKVSKLNRGPTATAVLFVGSINRGRGKHSNGIVQVVRENSEDAENASATLVDFQPTDVLFLALSSESRRPFALAKS